MKFLRIVFILLFLVMSMGLVSAQDNLNDTLQADIPATDEIGSFEELEIDISNANSTLEITKDYINDDYPDGIKIQRDNLVINGNNHAIDGNSQKIFFIAGSNITINNLVFKNAYGHNGGAILNDGTVTLNNVSFVNNSADFGGAIYNRRNGELNISNAFFSSKISDKLGQIYCAYSNMNIYNSTFLNITSSYAPALYIKSSNVSISNSRFVNLTAYITAGAIAIKEGGNHYIEGCEFINTSSSKNAGALNIDIPGAFGYFGDVVIVDTLFEDTYSDFGGALIQLGGNLCVNNSYFIDNSATYKGGSVYISYVSAEIDNCTFDSNGVKALENVEACGSAIYCDMSNLTLTNSRVINKSKESGSAIYACDSSYTIDNSVFMDNTNAIYTDFDKASSLVNNVYGNGSVSTNNTFVLETIMVGEGMELKLLNNSINVTNLPSSFDLRDWNWTSPVKEQGEMGACWVFAATEALESALRKACGITTDFSINNLQKTMIRYSNYGVNIENNGILGSSEGGTVDMSSSYLVSWLGAFPQDYDIYDEVGKISRTITTGEDIHIQDVIFAYNLEPGSPQMKSAILKCGSLCVGIYTERYSTPYFNPETNAQYVYDNISNDHAVAIVGWDDNYSKENFPTAPPGDGAWIIKNSWGTNWGDNGYMYLSYYDKSLLRGYFDDGSFVDIKAMGVIVENTIPYNKNYQYGEGWVGDDSLGDASYANVFEALDDDLIAAVGTYFIDSNVDYRVDVYVNGELKLTQEGLSPYAGFHTIKLDEYVPIKAGDIFTAVMTSNSMPVIYFERARAHYTPGLSYYIEDGIWEDLYDYDVLAYLKVYTVVDDSRIVDNEDILVDYGSGSCFSVRVVTADGHAVVGGDVVFTINGKAITVETDSKGTAKLEIVENPGVYVLTTRYNNQTCQNKVIVKSKSPDDKKDGGASSKPYGKTVRSSFQPITREDVVIVAKNVVVSQKEFSKGYSYKIILKSKTGKLLANKKVIIIFNGMIFIGFTDENGTVCFNLTGNMTGLFNITIIFEGDDFYNPICENRTVRIE